MDPATAAARSDKMSPNRLEATMTSTVWGFEDQPGGECIDQDAFQLNVGLVRCHRFTHDLIPERHGVDDAVGLGRRDELPLPSGGLFDGVPGDALDAAAGEHGFLDSGFVGLPAEHAAADLRVLAFDVLADDDDVELGDISEWGCDAWQDLDRTQVDVLVELPADRDQQTPKGDVVGNVGGADRAEQRGIAVAELIDGVDGLDVGDVVTGEQMRLLFAEGRHPLAETLPGGGRVLSLGVPYRPSTGQQPFQAALRARFADHNSALGLPRRAAVPADVRARLRGELAAEWFRQQEGLDPKGDLELASALTRWSRPAPAAVGGYDLTFSPVKSVSALWAIADLPVAAQIEQAHHAAVAEALRFIEDRALFTREGTGGVRQVNVTGPSQPHATCGSGTPPRQSTNRVDTARTFPRSCRNSLVLRRTSGQLERAVSPFGLEAATRLAVLNSAAGMRRTRRRRCGSGAGAGLRSPGSFPQSRRLARIRANVVEASASRCMAALAIAR
jgi:hypothetical protein